MTNTRNFSRYADAPHAKFWMQWRRAAMVARELYTHAARGGPAWFQGRYAANELTYHICRKKPTIATRTGQCIAGVCNCAELQ